jgi:hypothetical protein
MPVRVSFDSNAWEKIFDPTVSELMPIRDALADGRLKGFICEVGFRIEAIRKGDRASYFAQPHFGSRQEGIVMRDGRPYWKMSFGPIDERHPGLPRVQASKLQSALASGVQLMRGLNWMGLPAPQEIHNSTNFVSETIEERRDREQRQIELFARVDARGVGKAVFDAAGGWKLLPTTPADQKRLRKACAEWADGELVCAHVAYQNDVLCTNDRAQVARASIFDLENRAWLTVHYGVSFKTIDELMASIK